MYRLSPIKKHSKKQINHHLHQHRYSCPWQIIDGRSKLAPGVYNSKSSATSTSSGVFQCPAPNKTIPHWFLRDHFPGLRKQNLQEDIMGRQPKTSSVSCGSHSAPNCIECPQDHGAAWCNGECTWHQESDLCVAPSSILIE